MSCFGGKMREYDQISIDRFDNYRGNLNLQSTVYFLSHFHKDHTVGLNAERFLDRLKSNRKVFLYCTEVTKILMLGDPNFKLLEKHVKTLECDVASRVIVPDEYTEKEEHVTVTLIPAGHCPGSVMFLFEGKEGTVLYTGDFRWEGNEVSRIPCFKSGDSLKDIQSVYVDTTFCIPEAFHIPSRADCVEALYTLVQEWLAESPNNVVHMSSKTTYGHEHLLKGVADRLGIKVHVLPEKFQLYEQISELRDVFTPDPSQTRLHACWWATDRQPGSRLPCGHIGPQDVHVKVMTVRPSTMWFIQGVQIKDIYVKTRNLHRVCYSFHSSFAEVRDLVTYLKPRRVFPNVMPVNYTMEKVQIYLNQFLKLSHKEHVMRKELSPSKPLGILRKLKRNLPTKGSLSDSEELCFGDLATPKKRRRRASSASLPSTPGSGVKFNIKFSVDVSPEDGQGQNSQRSVSKSSDGDISDSQSSYTRSHHSDSELDLTAGGDTGDNECNQGEVAHEGSQSLTYISGDEEDDDYKQYVSQNHLLKLENSAECEQCENLTDHPSYREEELLSNEHEDKDSYPAKSEESTSQKEVQQNNCVTPVESTMDLDEQATGHKVDPSKTQEFSDDDFNEDDLLEGDFSDDNDDPEFNNLEKKGCEKDSKVTCKPQADGRSQTMSPALEMPTDGHVQRNDNQSDLQNSTSDPKSKDSCNEPGSWPNNSEEETNAMQQKDPSQEFELKLESSVDFEDDKTLGPLPQDSSHKLTTSPKCLETDTYEDEVSLEIDSSVKTQGEDILDKNSECSQDENEEELMLQMECSGDAETKDNVSARDGTSTSEIVSESNIEVSNDNAKSPEIPDCDEIGGNVEKDLTSYEEEKLLGDDQDLTESLKQTTKDNKDDEKLHATSSEAAVDLEDNDSGELFEDDFNLGEEEEFLPMEPIEAKNVDCAEESKSVGESGDALIEENKETSYPDETSKQLKPSSSDKCKSDDTSQDLEGGDSPASVQNNEYSSQSFFNDKVKLLEEDENSISEHLSSEKIGEIRNLNSNKNIECSDNGQCVEQAKLTKIEALALSKGNETSSSGTDKNSIPDLINPDESFDEPFGSMGIISVRSLANVSSQCASNENESEGFVSEEGSLSQSVQYTTGKKDSILISDDSDETLPPPPEDNAEKEPKEEDSDSDIEVIYSSSTPHTPPETVYISDESPDKNETSETSETLSTKRTANQPSDSEPKPKYPRIRKELIIKSKDIKISPFIKELVSPKKVIVIDLTLDDSDSDIADSQESMSPASIGADEDSLWSVAYEDKTVSSNPTGVEDDSISSNYVGAEDKLQSSEPVGVGNKVMSSSPISDEDSLESSDNIIVKDNLESSKPVGAEDNSMSSNAVGVEDKSESSDSVGAQNKVKSANPVADEDKIVSSNVVGIKDKLESANPVGDEGSLDSSNPDSFQDKMISACLVGDTDKIESSTNVTVEDTLMVSTLVKDNLESSVDVGAKSSILSENPVGSEDSLKSSNSLGVNLDNSNLVGLEGKVLQSTHVGSEDNLKSAHLVGLEDNQKLESSNPFDVETKLESSNPAGIEGSLFSNSANPFVDEDNVESLSPDSFEEKLESSNLSDIEESFVSSKTVDDADRMEESSHVGDEDKLHTLVSSPTDVDDSFDSLNPVGQKEKLEYSTLTGVEGKLMSSNPVEDKENIVSSHSACFEDKLTASNPVGDEENPSDIEESLVPSSPVCDTDGMEASSSIEDDDKLMASSPVGVEGKLESSNLPDIEENLVSSNPVDSDRMEALSHVGDEDKLLASSPADVDDSFESLSPVDQKDKLEYSTLTGVEGKLMSSNPVEDKENIVSSHSACFEDKSTASNPVGDEENPSDIEESLVSSSPVCDTDGMGASSPIEDEDKLMASSPGGVEGKLESSNLPDIEENIVSSNPVGDVERMEALSPVGDEDKLLASSPTDVDDSLESSTSVGENNTSENSNLTGVEEKLMPLNHVDDKLTSSDLLNTGNSQPQASSQPNIDGKLMDSSPAGSADS